MKNKTQKKQVRKIIPKGKLDSKTKLVKTKICHLKKKKRKKICVRKKLRVIRKTIINVVAPQGIQGPPGPQGIQGPASPQGSPGTEVTGINIIPSVQRYFTIVESDMPITTSRTFTANQFVNDAGESITQFTDYGRYGYFNLFINAVLQEGQLYSVNSNTITFQPTGQTIKAGTPIILESIGFTAEIITNH